MGSQCLRSRNDESRLGLRRVETEQSRRNSAQNSGPDPVPIPFHSTKRNNRVATAHRTEQSRRNSAQNSPNIPLDTPHDVVSVSKMEPKTGDHFLAKMEPKTGTIF